MEKQSRVAAAWAAARAARSAAWELNTTAAWEAADKAQQAAWAASQAASDVRRDAAIKRLHGLA